jgi:hypothetical protein
MSDDDYLFDGSGAPDPDVVRAERLLRPLGRKDDAPIAAAPVRRGGRLLLLGALVAAAAAVLVAVSMRPQAPTSGRVERVVAKGPSIRETGRDGALAVDQWVETTEAGREILVGDVGRVVLGAASRVQVRRVSDETTRLYLARGSLEARVSADARPRFFQVDTDAARCVDLGCRYTLEVDHAGDAIVRVITGQVAFEDGRREVFVPAGAVCAAKKGRGPGTPRFEDARRDVAAAFDAYDAAATAPIEARRDAARAALDTVREKRDTLPAWHLLEDVDAEIVLAAAARLEMVAGKCDAPAGASADALRSAWRARLAADCW